MSEKIPPRPFSFELPPEPVEETLKPRARPFLFDVDEPLAYEELRQASEIDADRVAAATTPEAERSGGLRWLLGFAVLFLVLVIGIDAYHYLSLQFSRSWVLGAVLSLALAGLVSSLLWLVGRELRDYRRLQRVCALREQAQACTEVESLGPAQAERLVRQFAQLYAQQPSLARRVQQFREGIGDHQANDEVLERFARVVIKPMDGQAYAIINRYAVDTAIVTAISPFAALDVLLTLWRNTRMIRAIATHYGVRPGLTGSITLLKYVLQNLVTAGASHYVSDALAETMGSDLMGKLSQRFSQGAINGLMTVRLGLMAAEQCRPLPFRPEDKHNFRQLFRNVRRKHERFTEQAVDEEANEGR